MKSYLFIVIGMGLGIHSRAQQTNLQEKRIPMNPQPGEVLQEHQGQLAQWITK